MKFISLAALIIIIGVALSATTTAHAQETETRCVRTPAGVCTNPTAPELATCSSPSMATTFSACCPEGILGGYDEGTACVLFVAAAAAAAASSSSSSAAVASPTNAAGETIETVCVRAPAGVCLNPSAPELATCTSTFDSTTFQGCCPEGVLGGGANDESHMSCVLFTAAKNATSDDVDDITIATTSTTSDESVSSSSTTATTAVATTTITLFTACVAFSLSFAMM